MCEYPLLTLVNSGIKDICVVVGGSKVGDFVSFLGNSREYDANIYFRYQKEPLGIAHGISLCQDFLKDDKFAVCLGDNIFSEHFAEVVKQFHEGATIVLKEHEHPEHFGVAQLGRKANIINIIEKPKEFISNLIITGFYLFDQKFFDYYNYIEPSKRNEYEITDILKQYNRDNRLGYVTYRGYWSDAGTYHSLLACNNYVAEHNEKFIK